MKKNNEKTKGPKRKTEGISVQGVSYKIFVKHFPVVLMVIFFAMWYISSRYDHITSMETVAKLNRELEIVRTEVQSERSNYMSATREKEMEQTVNELNLGLGIQEQPPYKLSLQ